MAQGRLQAERQLLIAQAAVLFFEGRPEDLEHFVRTGLLHQTRNVVPCSLKMLEGMQAQIDQRRKR